MYGTNKPLTKDTEPIFWTREMTQCAKVLAKPVFLKIHITAERKKEQVPTSFTLTSMSTTWHMCPYVHVHTQIFFKERYCFNCHTSSFWCGFVPWPSCSHTSVLLLSSFSVIWLSWRACSVLLSFCLNSSKLLSNCCFTDTTYNREKTTKSSIFVLWK